MDIDTYQTTAYPFSKGKLTIRYREMICFLLTLSVIVTSGSNVTITIFAAVAVLAFVNKKPGKLFFHNMVVFAILSGLLAINSIFYNTAATDYHEFYVFLIRFACLAVCCSVISVEKFFSIYVKILYYVFSVCLFFWVILFICNNTGHPGLLPPAVFDHFMMDSTAQFLRLKAIFWESGVCSIHANICLTYCICKGLKETKKYAIVYILAVVCSLSSTGFIVLALQGILYYLINKTGNHIPLKVIRIAAVALILLVTEEATMGIVMSKLIGHGHSFTSRFDDTILGLLIARDHTVFGIGVATDWHQVFLDYFANNEVYKSFQKYFSDDLASSNGLVNCLYKAGVPFTVFYIAVIFRKLRKSFGFRFMEAVVILLMYICFFIGEPIMSVPLMLMFFFHMRVKEPGNNSGRKLNEQYG